MHYEAEMSWTRLPKEPVWEPAIVDDEPVTWPGSSKGKREAIKCLRLQGGRPARIIEVADDGSRKVIAEEKGRPWE